MSSPELAVEPLPDPLAILRKVYGYAAFRPPQGEIIDHVIAGNHAFVLMPTGGGKSLCYQIPALCRPGVGVVISPLIALMEDQVTALRQLGVKAAALHSGIPAGDAAETRRRLRAGQLDLLYVAPERLLMDDFLDLLGTVEIALFAIDEAHCVSQWGHDFRPHYIKLALLAELFPNVPRIGLTATADEPTRKDIVERLQLGPHSFISGFDRPNIYYGIQTKSGAKQQLLGLLARHQGESGIVYCLSRAMVEDTAAWLKAEGYDALPYHAGLDAETRSRHQQRFLKDDRVIMTATIAFGMGIDKPDVRFVAHLSLPKNIEAYYQETGRAGRDGLPAEALLLHSGQDAAMQRQFIEESESPPAQKRIEHQKLNALLGLCEAAQCRRQILLNYFGDASGPCGNCDNCQQPQATFDGTLGAQKAISCVYRSGQRFGVGYVTDLLTGKDDPRIRQFGHENLSTYGIGKEYGKTEWASIFRQIIARGLLKVDVTGHGGLSITPEGFRFLKEKETIQLKEPQKKTLREKTAKLAKATLAFASEQDAQLFGALRTRRMEIAKAQNVPPYVIFHDRTLHEMAALRPQTLEAMGTVGGVGQAKLERYGEALLAVILAFE